MGGTSFPMDNETLPLSSVAWKKKVFSENNIKKNNWNEQFSHKDVMLLTLVSIDKQNKAKFEGLCGAKVLKLVNIRWIRSLMTT